MHIEIGDRIRILEKPTMWSSECSNNCPIVGSPLIFPLNGVITSIRRAGAEHNEAFGLEIDGKVWGFSSRYTKMKKVSYIPNKITIL